MAKHRFKPSERYAVFTVHGETCYICRKPIDMASFEVDHILPESLGSQPEVFEKVRNSYCLTDAFDLNSFENWLPACPSCNNRKTDAVFEALPIFAVELKRASDKAEQARAIEAKVRSNQKVARAITIVEVAHQHGTLGAVHVARLRPLIEFHEAHREPGKVAAPLLIGPGVEVLNQYGHLLLVKGPYGIGSGIANPPEHGGFRCGSCGFSAWSGARCVVCGALDDD